MIWDPLLGIGRCEIFGVGPLAWHLARGRVLGVFVQELSFAILRLGTFVWKLSFAIFRL